MAKKTTPTITPSYDLADISTWGVEKQGGKLTVNGSFETTGPLIIDVENNQDGSCAGIGLGLTDGHVFFYTPDRLKNFHKKAFAESTFIGHNLKYDVQKLRSWGFNVSPDQIVWDTQIAEYVRDSTRFKFGLKPLVKEIFGASYPDYKAIAGTGKKAVDIGSVDSNVVANYCGNDVLFTYRLYQKQLAEMSEQEVRYLEDIELPTMRVLLEMEERGVQIDASYCRDLHTRFSAEIGSVVDGLRAIAGAEVNFNSPVQVKRFLLDKAGLKLESTGAEILKNIKGVPVVKDLLRYRELSKLKSTYVDVLLERNPTSEASSYRLNARFNQTATDTGRLSSSEPNLQNIPSRTDEGALLRKAFIAKPGHVLVDFDYSQIEPRLMAHISGDPNLKRVFIEGHDLYNYVAEVVGLLKSHSKDEARRISKILWLAMAYNAGAWKIGQTAGISVADAEVFLTRMKLAFQQFFYWRSRLIAQAELDQGVRTIFGRFIPLSSDAAHLGPNYVIQGSAAEIMKLAMQATRHLPGVLTVHDELVFEIPEKDADVTMREVSDIMSNVVELTVPLEVEAGKGVNWGVAKP